MTENGLLSGAKNPGGIHGDGDSSLDFCASWNEDIAPSSKRMILRRAYINSISTGMVTKDSTVVVIIHREA